MAVADGSAGSLRFERNGRLVRVARGRWQVGLYERLVSGGMVAADASRELVGKAGTYAGRYQESLDQLIARMREAGWALERVPGPRGGAGHWRIRDDAGGSGDAGSDRSGVAGGVVVDQIDAGED